MKKRSLLFLAFSLAVILWCLNYVALMFYLYWATVWYDMIMHFVGGLTIAVFLVLLFRIEIRSRKSFFLIFLLVMAIGVAWEIFEYLIDDTFAIEGYFLDASADLVLDALGVIVAYFITTSRSRESF